MNKIEMNPERYLVADLTSTQKSFDTLNELLKKIPNPKEFFGKDYGMIKKATYDSNNIGVETVANWLMKHKTGELKWLGFKLLHDNEKCVWDKETGEMFVIN